MKWRLSGCVMSCAIVFAMHVIALPLSSEKLGVGRPMTLAAMLVERVSLTQFVTEGRNRWSTGAGWVEQCFGTTAGGDGGGGKQSFEFTDGG